MQNSISPTYRKSSIELLRIIAMIMIIAHHFAVHGGFAFSANEVSAGRLWLQFLKLGGKVGVDIFVLISGYFLITAEKIKTNKAIRLWTQIFTYSAGIFLIFLLCKVQPLDPKAALKNLLPITFSGWWFASAYFVLYLISPYLNKLLTAISKKEYLGLLAFLFFAWCILPTFLDASWELSTLLWFVFLYAVAGYVRLYTDVTAIRSGMCLFCSLIATLLTYMWTVAFDVLGTKYSFFAVRATAHYDMFMLPVFAIAFFMFMGFINLDIGHIPFINLIASATFGVYLIHDNNYIRPLLWEKIFKNASYQHSDFLIPYSVIVIISVFAGCTALELFRIYIIEKPLKKATNKVSDRIDKCADNFPSNRLLQTSTKLWRKLFKN